MINEIILITAIILTLYLKTYKYNNLIDDKVPRSGYLTVMTCDVDDYSHSKLVRSWLATFTNIGVFWLCCMGIYLIWGFWPAVFFACFPLNVSGVAWTTGNYYMTTTWLVIVTHYFCYYKPVWGMAVGIPIYVGAIHSSLAALPYAFMLPFLHHKWWAFLLIPSVVAFLLSPRFVNGVKRRKQIHDNLHTESGEIRPSVVFRVVRVIGYYIAYNVWPSRLGFFSDYGHYACHFRIDRLFWLCLSLIGVYAVWSWSIDPVMCLWWFFSIGVFSQFTTLGMFTAERYTYTANVAWCVLLAKWLEATYPQALPVVASLWFYHSWQYVRAYKSNETLFSYSMQSFPNTAENANNLGAFYMGEGRHDKAIFPFLYALKFSPVFNFNLMRNLMTCYARIGHYEKALRFCVEMKDKCPKDELPKLIEEEKELKDKLMKMAKNQEFLKKKGII